MCELCFLHSTAIEAINQMRKHQTVFFSSAPGIYPTPQLASIEYLLWKAKQCYHFAKLFEQAVNNGLSALATLNPGTHLDQAASIFSAANTEIAALKRSELEKNLRIFYKIRKKKFFLDNQKIQKNSKNLKKNLFEKSEKIF